MRIGMTIPFMEPGWNRQAMQHWAQLIDLRDFLTEIRQPGADDVILVPTSADPAAIETLARALY